MFFAIVVTLLNRRHHMRKHISFSIAATIAGLAMVFWATFGVVYTKAEIARPKVGLSSSIAPPHLPVQVLAPIFD
jgi:hypothetical protein